MPADFLLTNLKTAPSSGEKSASVDLFQENQRDSAARNADFSRDFQREVQRANDVATADRRESQQAERRSRDQHAATQADTDRESGNSLPPRNDRASTERQESVNVQSSHSVNQRESRSADRNDQANRQNVGSDGARTTSQSDKAPLVEKQLNEQQRQALESVRNQIRKLQLNDTDPGLHSEALQSAAESAGVELEGLVSQFKELNQLTDGEADLSLTSDLKELVDSLEQKIAALLQRLEQPPAMEGAGKGIKDQPPGLVAALESLKSLDEALQNLLSDEGSSEEAGALSAGDAMQIAQFVMAGTNQDLAGQGVSEQATDLSALLNGQGVGASMLSGAGDGKPGATAAPWSLSQSLSASESSLPQSLAASESSLPQTLADRIKALSQELKGTSGSEPAEKTGTTDQPGKENKDVDFILKNADKLSAKAQQALGDLSLSELSEQARQLSKSPDGVLQQKLKDVVDQIKTAMVEGSRAGGSGDTADTTSSRQSPAIQPLNPFMKSMEQATSAQQMQKTTMTMQNHFNKPAWAGELGQRLMMMVGQKIQVAEIRLDPPDLGPMEVKVRMQQEQAHVVFNSQHSPVRDALEQALPRLREMFEQNGLSLGDVDVQDQTAQQGDSHEDGGHLATGESAEGEGDSTPVEQVQVTTSDRLVDYYA